MNFSYFQFCLDSNYFKTFESKLGSTVNAVKSKMTQSKSTMHFNGNVDQDMAEAVMTTSLTHDEHLNFGGNSEEKKKDLTNK